MSTLFENIDLVATQLHLAHSKNIKGVGMVAGSPFYCAYDNLVTALACVENGPIFVNPLIQSVMLTRQKEKSLVINLCFQTD